MADGSSSVIADGTVIVGRVSASGDLDVFGHVEGSIEAGGTLTIGDGATVKCQGSDLMASIVAVSGAVAGSERSLPQPCCRPSWSGSV